MTLLCKKIIVAKCKEVKSRLSDFKTNLAESSKEDYGSKRAVNMCVTRTATVCLSLASDGPCAKEHAPTHHLCIKYSNDQWILCKTSFIMFIVLQAYVQVPSIFVISK
jgi:hypothetical protein